MALHWYDTEGNAAHEIDGKKTTLREARKHELWPSVTGVIDQLNKPALTNWKMNQLYSACWEILPDIVRDMDNNAYNQETVSSDVKSQLFHKADQKAREARDKGTAIHEAFDDYVLTGLCSNPTLLPLSEKILGYINANFGAVHSTELSFACNEYGYGGSIDVVGKEFILDIKTKDFTPDQNVARFVFDSHLMQLAAYAKGIDAIDSKLINLFVSTNADGSFGEIKHYIWSDDDHAKGWLMYYNLLQYWQLSKKYGPLYERGDK